MTRKVNLSHLSKNECDRILAVIQRDSNLRQKEQERLSKIEEELNDRASQRSVLAKRKEFNEKWCILCCSTFNLLFNKKLYCHDCHFYVCRSCAVWQSQEKIWLCRLCEHQRVLYIQSCEWFYDHVRKKFKHFGSSKIFIKALCKKRKESDSENDSGYGPTSENSITSKSLLALFSPRMHSELKQEEPCDASSITDSHCSHTEEEEDVGEVRQHVETVVEGLIGSSSLDTARVDFLYDHTLYDQLFTKYHPQLSTAAGLLANALHRAMQNDVISENEVTPTAAHAALKELIIEVTDKARNMPVLKEIDESSQNNNNRTSVLSDNCNPSVFTTYNDLLAAAIINKIIEMQQQQLKKQDNSKSIGEEADKFIGVTHNGNESSSEEENEARKPKGNFTWDDSLSKQQPCIEYVIEEIEEIMQECTDSEEDESSKMSLHSSNQSINEIPTTKSVITRTDEIPDLDVLSELDITGTEKVPFPELGMDIVEINEDQQIDEEPKIDSCIMSVSAWEENWLFRKKRFPLYSSLGMRLMASYNDPPSMVIPNPADDAQVLIGTRQLDQLSELSEINSVGSLEYSSDDNFENKDENEEITFSKSKENIIMEHMRNPSKLENNQCIQADTVPKYHSLPLSYKNINTYLEKLNGLIVPKYSSRTCRKSAVTDPIFVETPENQTLHAGKRACFICKASGTKPVGVAWFWDKQQLLPGPKYNMYSINGKYVLEIYNTIVYDSGTYSCVIFNSKGENWKDFTLKLKDSSRAEVFPEFAVSLRILNCAIGDNTKLMCTVSGYPEPRLHIFFNSREIENNAKYKIYNTGYGEWVIEIINFELCDQGEYVAVAINRLGQSSSKTVLLNGSSDDNEKNILLNTNTHTACAEEKENELYKAKALKNFTECRNALSSKHISINANDNLHNLENEENEINDLNIPPKPGTIAEREHRKWLNAVPLSNNPYSAANLAKRLGRKQISSIGRLPSVSRSLTYEELENQQLQDSYGMNGNVSIICAPVDPFRYQRDYYINHIPNNNYNNQKKLNVNSNFESSQEAEENIFHENLGNEEALNSLEEKVYISAGKVFTLENHVRRLEREIQSVTNLDEIAFLEKQTAKAVATVSKNDQQIFQLEREIVQLQKSAKEQRCLEKKDILREASNHSDDELPSLPSVKDLATKFTLPTCTKTEVPPPQLVKISPPEKKVVVVDKVSRNSSHDDLKEKPKATLHSSRMVHSLTARNLPREFRKQALDHLPKPMNRTIFLKGSDNSSIYSSNMNAVSDNNNDSTKKGSESASESFHGYTSDESTASNSSISIAKPKRKTSHSILQRASYWEKRAEQNLLSDSSVSEDFPAMKNVPN